MPPAAKLRGFAFLLALVLAVPRPTLPCSSLAFLNNGSPIFGTNYDNPFAPGLLFINRRGVRINDTEDHYLACDRTGAGAEAAVGYAFELLAGVAASNTRWSFVCDIGARVLALFESFACEPVKK